MTTGLFPIRQSECGMRKGRKPRNRLASNGYGFTTNKRLLAEALAEGSPTVRSAGEAIGVGYTLASKLFRAIRADLGGQAR